MQADIKNETNTCCIFPQKRGSARAREPDVSLAGQETDKDRSLDTDYIVLLLPYLITPHGTVYTYLCLLDTSESQLIAHFTHFIKKPFRQ